MSVPPLGLPELEGWSEDNAVDGLTGLELAPAGPVVVAAGTLPLSLGVTPAGSVGEMEFPFSSQQSAQQVAEDTESEEGGADCD